MKVSFTFALILLALCASAQEPVRPVSACWAIEVGSAHLADTYLSPVKYSGAHFGVEYARRRAMSRRQWVQGWNLGVHFNRAKNPAGNASMLSPRVNGSWHMTCRWQLPHGFQAGVGGFVAADLGALYLSRNGNNPVQAQATANIGPEMFGQWRKGIYTLRVAAGTSLIGTFFCPDYGELYYEIALGNHGGLAHCAWPGNFRQLHCGADLDICLGHTTLRIGYKFQGQSTKANHITSRRIEHSAVVGIVTNFITINPRHEKVITAF